MSTFVVDASVAAKWYFPEVHAEAARRYLRGDHALVAPDLLPAELGNAVWKRVRRGDISRPEGKQILSGFWMVPLELHPSRKLLDVALDIGASTGRTVYDCLYLAVALLNGCRLVTADRRFFEQTRRHGFSASLLWIEEPI